jgi:retron-type reverse transcriptase
MARHRTDLNSLWRAVEQAGTIEAYVEAQLRERGFVVERRETEQMSPRELEAYKKSLREEAAERRRLRQEAWRAYKANHIVHLGEGVYWNDADDWDKWDLENAEERAAANELPPLDKPKQLAEALSMSVADLRWLTFHRDAAENVHYRPFTLAKRDGSQRQIWAPMPRLKAAQRWILREILEKLPIHGAVHGFLPGRSILSNAHVHTDSQIILKMDIKDFFPTITFSRVRGVFRRAGYRKQISTLLAMLCTEAPREVVEQDGKTYYVALGQRCLPQGAPTSPAITNTLCRRMDHRLSGLARKLGWRYTRYADDLTFSLPHSHKGPPRLGTLLGTVTRIVQQEGFAIHAKKTRVARSGSRQTVTGLVVNGDGLPRVPRKLRRELRAAIHNLRQGKPLEPGDTPERLAGYAAYIAMTDPALGRKMLEAIGVPAAK